jgi:uncharacterized protein YjaZ
MLHIISAYQGIFVYIRAARQHSQTDWISLWKQHAIEPYWESWAAGQFNEERTRQQMQNPITDLDALTIEADLLACSGVEQIIQDAYARMTALLPSPASSRTICIYPLDPADRGTVERMHGVVGTCVGDNILMQINPTAPGWLDWVPYVLAHEYHHTIWGYNYFAVQGYTKMDLLTGFIVDGQADSFAGALFPDFIPLWVNGLTPQQEASLWLEVRSRLRSEDPADYRRFMFGDEAAGIPWCAGYTLGYRLVQNYLRKHSGQSWVDLLNINPWNIYQDLI